MENNDLARRSDRALVSDQAAPRLDPPGFDPSRIRRPGFATRLQQFEMALFDLPWVADRVLGGHQFNAYESAANDDYDDPDDWKYQLCLGPIGDARFICPLVGRDRAMLVEAALKAATEAMLERRARDSDGSPKGGDGVAGSVHDSAAIAQPSPASSLLSLAKEEG